MQAAQLATTSHSAPVCSSGLLLTGFGIYLLCLIHLSALVSLWKYHHLACASTTTELLWERRPPKELPFTPDADMAFRGYIISYIHLKWLTALLSPEVSSIRTRQLPQGGSKLGVVGGLFITRCFVPHPRVQTCDNYELPRRAQAFPCQLQRPLCRGPYLECHAAWPGPQNPLTCS